MTVYTQDEDGNLTKQTKEPSTDCGCDKSSVDQPKQEKENNG